MNTILFDLDGTLLTTGEEAFVNAYFSEIVKKFVPLGYTKDELIQAILLGTRAMYQNVGEHSNKDIFWSVFEQTTGKSMAQMEALFDEFYTLEFHRLREILSIHADHREFVDALKKKGYKLVIASSPVFPPQAFDARLEWMGLRREDFIHISDYENAHYCKSSPHYYSEIFRAIGAEPSQCLMIGNNVAEDGQVTDLGAHFYLVTDYMENKKNLAYDHFMQGGFEEMKQYCLGLPEVG